MNKEKEILNLELLADYKPGVINTKLNELVRDIKKITTRKDVVIKVMEK